MSKQIFGKPLVMIIAALSMALAISTCFASTPKDPYITYDAHPYEGCVYGKWTVLSPTNIYQSKDTKSPVITTVKPGDIITALTGEIHTHPLKVLITKDCASDQTKFKANDTIYILASTGEGYFNIWKNGKIYAICPTDLYGSAKTDDGDNMFMEKFSSVWWIQVKLANGKTGWTNQGDNFGNKDRFSGKYQSSL